MTPEAGSVTAAGAEMAGSEQLVAVGAVVVAGGAAGGAWAVAAGAEPGRGRLGLLHWWLLEWRLGLQSLLLLLLLLLQLQLCHPL